uniref:Uncharacterized protein n=1 Tax=Amphimedon queenslandica TaxID=400682 RepID=A0A1X7TK53_AMPQE
MAIIKIPILLKISSLKSQVWIFKNGHILQYVSCINLLFPKVIASSC